MKKLKIFSYLPKYGMMRFIKLSLILCILQVIDIPTGGRIYAADNMQYIGQQESNVNGLVTDKDDIPVSGATVIIKGTSIGTITDENGQFSLESVPDKATIQVSYIGFLTQEVSITNKKYIHVQLVEDIQSLDEVVVVGYATQKVGEISSAISSIKADDFSKTPTIDVAQAIKGKIPGLQITTTSSDPTGSSQISLRGINSLNSGSNPLVLVDGIPSNLNTVSPDNIERIDVLKDASAAAIYGTRGANGVILVTTKGAKGGDMPTEVTVNAYVSTEQIVKRLPFLNASQYRQKAEEGIPGCTDDGADVDWLDEVTRTPLSQVYNISLRGGSKSTNYAIYFEYKDSNGLMKRSNNVTYYPSMEITHRMFNDKLKLTANLRGFKRTFHTGGDGSGFDTEVYRNALIYNPTTPIYQEDGTYSFVDKNAYNNPVALLNEAGGERRSTQLQMNANAVYTPIKDLDIKYLYSSTTYTYTAGYYRSKDHPSSIRSNQTGFASRGTDRTTQDQSELTVSYKGMIEDHHFSALAGYSWMKNTAEFYWMQNYNFPSDLTTYNNMGSGQALKDGLANEHSEASEEKLIAYFGRFNYNYKEKYMFAASIRHEGSTKFGTNYKWGNFPSVSAAWNIHSEEFMQGIHYLTALKFRLGYGITGTVPGSSYVSIPRLNIGNYSYFNGDWEKNAIPSSNANPNFRWEKNKELNVGLDFGFLKDRITGSIDYYKRKTDDLIWNYSVPTPPYLYSTITANAGSMENKGIEIGLNVTPIQTKKFQWVSTINFSSNKNKLVSLSNDEFVAGNYSDQGSTGEPIWQSTHRVEVGEPIGNFYGYKAIDIDESGHWIVEGSDGNPKSLAEATPSDKKIIGNGLPKHYMGFSNTIRWNGIDFSITMHGAFGFDILNGPRLQYGAPVMLGRGNVLSEAFDVKFNKVPLAMDQSLEYVDYYIEKGNYLKIDNLTLGYTFKFHDWAKQLRIYGVISNLATISGYSGIDPEVSVKGLAPGVDDKNRYPSTRTYTLGLSFVF